MKRFVIAALSVLGVAAVAAPASAADLPARMPTKAPAYVAPYYNWTGFYLGVNGGGGWFSNGGSGGGFGGGQIGYNWQMNQLVLGLEVDAQGGRISDSNVVPGVATFDQRIDAFGTVRGRIGYAWNTLLLYGTGGFAWAADRQTATTPAGLVFTNDDTRTGYALGAGLEWAFAPQWSAKVEYQYLDFGNRGNLFGLAGGPTREDIHTIRVGLNYHFTAPW